MKLSIRFGLVATARLIMLAINQKQLKIIRFMHNRKSTETTKTFARTKIKAFKKVEFQREKNKIISKKKTLYLPKQIS